MTSKFEYELTKVRIVRNLQEAKDYLNGFGKRGFQAIYTVKDNQDLIVLFEKETVATPKAAKPAKSKSE
jgi:hypothetical protein